MADTTIDFAAIDGGAETQTDTQTDVSSAETQQGNQESQQQDTAQRGSGEVTQQQAQPAADGRRGPKEYRDAARAADQALPEHAKTIREMVANMARFNEYQTVFPNVNDARSAKELLDAFGGPAGAAELQQRISGYDAQEQGLESGDPAVLDSFFQDYPQGAATLAGPYLERLDKLNPQALREAVGPYAVRMLAEAGIPGYVASIMQETDAGRVQGMVKQLHEWMQGQSQAVQQLGRTQQSSPEAQRFQKEREQLQRERDTVFQDAVDTQAESIARPEVEKIIQQYAKPYKLSQSQMDHYRDSLVRAAIDSMNANQTYKSQMDVRKGAKNRTVQGLASYMAGEFTRSARDLADKTIKAIYGNAPNGAAQQGNGEVRATEARTAPGGGPLKITYVPTNDQLDTSKPNFEMMRIQGRGYLKNGRFVDWSEARRAARA